MKRVGVVPALLLPAIYCLSAGFLWGAVSTDISLEVNCSAILDRPAGVKRISVANTEIAEAVATSTTEVVINGKAPGETTLIVWEQGGNRSVFTVQVLPASSKIALVRDEILREAGPNVGLTAQDGLLFLNGTAKDLTSAHRALEIASSLGKVVNLLHVSTPASAPQILLKVRFADIDRSISNQFAFNLVGNDAKKGQGGSSTGQFGANPMATNLGTVGATETFSNLLNIFYFRPDINIGAILQDLAAKNLLQILAEPNLLSVSGKAASFLAGGEFPFPTLQGGGSGVGQVTIQFREFGIKLNFTPTVTPRGTIRLEVRPEVSSLDYSNGLTVGGFTIPGLGTRRVDTEVELKDGQSFVIAGLLDNQITEQLSRMPGLANIPFLGKLFQSRNISKSNSELLILVTPELVNPIPADQKAPGLKMPESFLEGPSTVAPQTPRDPNAAKALEWWRRESLPIEDLQNMESSRPLSSSSITPVPNVADAAAAAGLAGGAPPPAPASGDNNHPH